MSTTSSAAAASAPFSQRFHVPPLNLNNDSLTELRTMTSATFAERLAQRVDYHTLVDSTGRRALHYAVSAVHARELIQGLVNICKISVDVKADDGRTPLHDAASGDHLEAVRALVELRASPSSPDNQSVTPLDQALEKANEAMISLLFSALPDANERSRVFFVALRNGQRAIALKLTELGADPNTKSFDERDGGAYPLHLAVMHGWGDVVSALLAGGADPRACNADGHTPLHFACVKRDLPIVRILLPVTDKAILDARGVPLIHYCPKPLLDNIECLHLFAAHHVDLNMPDEDGSPLLHHICEDDSPEALGAILALPAFVNIHLPNRLSQTPLHVAYLRQKWAHISLLLKAGADPSKPNAAGESVLLMATREGREAQVKEFLEHKANPDHLSSQGETPLLVACAKGLVSIARLLLTLGKADPNLGNATTTPLQAAGTNLEMIELLLQHRAYLPPPGLVATVGRQVQELCNKYWGVAANERCIDPDLITLYNHLNRAQVAARLLKGANPNVIDTKKTTLLDLTLASGDTKTTELVLQAYPDLHLGDPLTVAYERDAQTAHDWPSLKLLAPYYPSVHTNLLHYACAKGQLEAATIFLELKANPDKVDEHGKTPVHSALFARNGVAMVGLLAAHHANLDLPDLVGSPVLCLACQFTNGPFVTALLNHRADPNARDANGRSALYHAYRAGREFRTTFFELLARGADPDLATGPNDESLVLTACKEQDLEALQQLLRYHAFPNTPFEQVTPLIHCCRIGMEEFVRALLTSPLIEVNQSIGGETPIGCATEFQHYRIATMLQERGAILPRSRSKSISISAGSVPQSTSRSPRPSFSARRDSATLSSSPGRQPFLDSFSLSPKNPSSPKTTPPVSPRDDDRLTTPRNCSSQGSLSARRRAGTVGGSHLGLGGMHASASLSPPTSARHHHISGSSSPQTVAASVTAARKGIIASVFGALRSSRSTSEPPQPRARTLSNPSDATNSNGV